MKKKWPYKTGDHSKGVQYIWIFFWQDKKWWPLKKLVYPCMWLLYVHRIYSVMLHSFLIQSRWYKFDCFLSLPIYKIMYQHIFVDKLRIVKSTSCSNVMAVAQWRQMRQMPHFWNGKCNLWKQIKSSFFSKFV